MQQATYRSRTALAGSTPASGGKTLELLGLLAGELAGLASMAMALAGSLLIAASYLL